MAQPPILPVQLQLLTLEQQPVTVPADCVRVAKDCDAEMSEEQNSTLATTERTGRRDDKASGTTQQQRPPQFWDIVVPRNTPKGANIIVKYGHATPARISLPSNFQPSSGEKIRVKVPQECYRNKKCRADLPPNLLAGQKFHVVVGGMLVSLVCPDTYIPGQRLRFEAPYINSMQYAVTMPAHDLKLRSREKIVKIKTTDGSIALYRAMPEIEAGQKIRVHSSNLTTQYYEVVLPPELQSGRPFLFRIGRKNILLHPTLPNEETNKIRFCLPIDEAEGTNLQLEDSRPTVPELAHWKMLPEDLLANVLEFLSVKEVRDWRLADSQFAAAGKRAMEAKLRRAGVEGTEYEQLVANAVSFLDQAEREQTEIEHVLTYAKSFRQTYRPIIVNFLPLGFGTRVLDRLKNPFLLKFCEVTDQPTRFVAREAVGIDLEKAGLSLYVWVSQYRKELQEQLELLPQCFDDTRSRVERALEAVVPVEQAGVKMMLVTYIPKVLATGEANESTIFEYIVDVISTGPLAEKYERRLRGVGRSPEIVTGGLSWLWSRALPACEQGDIQLPRGNQQYPPTREGK